MYLSFSLLVCLFIIGGIVTFGTLSNNRKSSEKLTEVVDPSLRLLEDYKKMIVESKMYTTNWVFLRYSQEDKMQLRKLHESGYPALKAKFDIYTPHWIDQTSVDSLRKALADFDTLLVIEKSIMTSLHEFSDYDDPVKKMEAERKVEDEILPRTTTLLARVEAISNRGLVIRKEQNQHVEESSMRLRSYIIILVIAMIVTAVLLSVYMTKVIIRPIAAINQIINDLGKGIISQINRNVNGDEIGRMTHSVNTLSEKLRATANFAQEVGRRNFNEPYQPLSEDDTLGKALITMCENLRSGEANLESKNKELERKNKELEQFAYVASHDLQEPLRTISSFVELFRQQYQGKIDDKADKYINYIVHSSTRMRTLITDLLEYSRIGSNKEWQQVDCNKVVAEILADLNAAVSETNAAVEYKGLPVVIGYQTEIKQLFQNLIFNAIKFRRKGIQPRVRISAIRLEDNWQFSVTDNGIGIAEEHHNRIFIIFQRLHTRNEYPGSGIGLSHCRKIVELHKGKIWLKSNPGTGTTFFFTISRGPSDLWPVKSSDYRENVASQTM